jgi:hypothetical protein
MEGIITMQVYAKTNGDTDIPYWFTREIFYMHFDQADFLDRDVQEVQAAYLNDWFHTTDEGICRFNIPVVSAVDGKTDLVGSRHRLAVLLPHLEELPIAVATAHLSLEAERFLDRIPKRALDRTIPFWIPDLPVYDELPYRSERRDAGGAELG